VGKQILHQVMPVQASIPYLPRRNYQSIVDRIGAVKEKAANQVAASPYSGFFSVDT
jgi:hypothetical protein